MRTSLAIGALAAAVLASGTAAATEIAVGKSRLVIDVEFWGADINTTEDPANPGHDLVSRGDPVHGTFRIFADRAPAPQAPTGPIRDGQSYGDNWGTTPTGAAFVTSRLLSPLPSFPPPGATHQVSAAADTKANDFVVMGDHVQFQRGHQDWFEVSDQFSPVSEGSISGESLRILVRSSSLDFLDGSALDQAFELDDLQDKEGTFAQGWFRAKVGDAAVAFREFFVDRVRVTPTPHVCKS